MTNLLSEAPKSVGRRIPVLLVAITLSVLPALAADRHVLLDTDGDGQLNDCPNPAHNAKGSSVGGDASTTDLFAPKTFRAGYSFTA